MKKILFPLLALALVGAFFLMTRDVEVSEKSFEYIDSGESIKIADEDGNLLFNYSIQEFRSWAKENWDDLFEERPSFGELREVDPELFYLFNKTASFSPKFDKLAFSVSDYAAATDISFIGIIDIETREVDLIRDKNIGGVREIIWSPRQNYLAYILDTARAGGDFISIDEIDGMKKIVTLSEKDLNQEQDFLMPEFHELSWSDDEEKLFFKTDFNEVKSWSFNLSDKIVQLEE